MATAELQAVLPDLFRGIDLAGVLVNGVLGGIVARQRRFDAVGFAVLAIISALGGGMLRDTLLQAGTPVALVDPFYLTFALVGALIAFLLRMNGKWWNRLLLGADSLALGCWAATGTAKALTLGLGWLPAILLGVTTAVGGGMIRDIAVGQVPAVFGGNTLQVVPALLATIAMIGLHEAGEDDLGMLAAIVVASGLSLLARWRRWTLPVNDGWSLPLTASQLRDRRADRARRRRRPGD